MCNPPPADPPTTAASDGSVGGAETSPTSRPQLATLGSSCDVRHADGHTHTGMCGEIGLDNAGWAFADAIGSSSLYVWALGLLAAGQAATMVCT